MKTKIILTSLFATFVGMQSFAADAEKRVVYKEFENDKGNTVQIRKKGQTDGEGNARATRQFRVTDADGEVVARGRDRGRKNADGKRARRTQKQWTDSRGNRHSKKRVRKSKAG